MNCRFTREENKTKPKSNKTMSIIPKEGNKKEAIVLLPLFILHQFLGIGIMFIGQRMKNRTEFIGGFLYFVWLLYSIFLGTSRSFLVYNISAILGWVYVIGRLLWIYSKKENQIKVV